jgi:hypothetical protein
MRGPSGAPVGLITRGMDDSGVWWVAKRSYLTPELTTAWFSRTRALGLPSPLRPVPAEGVDGSGPGQDFTAVRPASWDEVFLTGAQGNLLFVDE